MSLDRFVTYVLDCSLLQLAASPLLERTPIPATSHRLESNLFRRLGEFGERIDLHFSSGQSLSEPIAQVLRKMGNISVHEYTNVSNIERDIFNSFRKN
jgi:hypothetical protein